MDFNGWSVLEQGKVIIYMNSTRKSIAEQDYMHELPPGGGEGINPGIIIHMNFEKEVALEQGRSSYIYEYKEKINTRIRLYAWTSRGINAGIIIHMNSEKEVGLEQGRSSYICIQREINTRTSCIWIQRINTGTLSYMKLKPHREKRKRKRNICEIKFKVGNTGYGYHRKRNSKPRSKILVLSSSVSSPLLIQLNNSLVFLTFTQYPSFSSIFFAKWRGGGRLI